MHNNRVWQWPLIIGLAMAAFPHATTAQDPGDSRTMTIVILNEDGQPQEGVSVRAGIWRTSPVAGGNPEKVSDATGRVQFELPDDMYILRLWVWADGYTRLFANWEESEIKAGNVPPDEYTFRMIRGSTIGGVIQDEDGEPIAGARIGIAATATHPDSDGRLRFGRWYAEADDNSLLTTDEQGRWSLDTLPPAEDLQVQITLSHEDYIDDTRGELQRAQGVTTQQLRDGTATIVMQKGIAITGQLTNEDGEPVSNGLVVWGDRPYRDPGTNEVRIGLNGSYELPAMPPGKMRVTIMAPGYRPETRVVDIESMMEPVDFQLVPGKTLSVMIVDNNGEPVPGAFVGIESWRDAQSIYNNRHPHVINSQIPIQADAGGIYRWTWAPDDEVVYSMGARGYAPKRNIRLKASADLHVIELFRALELAGDVFDRESGERIEEFVVVPLNIPDPETQPDFFRERRNDAEQGRNGRFRISMMREGTYRFRIEAQGYRSADTEAFTAGEEVPRLRIELESQPWPAGRIVDDGGDPIAGAQVVLAMKSRSLSLRNYEVGRLVRAPHTMTDEAGQFQFAPQNEPYTLLALHDSGFAEVDKHPGGEMGEIQLRPWVTLTGTLFGDDGQPVPGVRVAFQGVRYRQEASWPIQDLTFATTDEQGRFRFERVPPIIGTLRSMNRNHENLRAAPAIPVDLTNGKGHEVNIGDTGIEVTGRVVLTGSSLDVRDLSNSAAEILQIAPPPFGLPQLLQDKGYDWQKGWSEVERARETPWEVLAYRNSFWHCRVMPDTDGRFTVKVPAPGTYDLDIHINVLSPTGESTYAMGAGRRTMRIEIDESDSGTVDVGNLEIQAHPEIKAGDPVPSFAFRNSGGKTATLKDYAGRYVLLHFWNDREPASQQDLPRLEELAGTLAEHNSDARIISMSSPRGREDIQRATDIEDYFIDGRPLVDDDLPSDQQDFPKICRALNIWWLPRYLIVDPEGNLAYIGDLEGALEVMGDVVGQ